MAFATTGQSPDFLAGLLEITGDAVIAIDERYVITMWSKGAERLYGWTAAEMVGARTDELTPSGGLLALAERRRALNAAGRWRGMVPIRRSDGARVEVEADCTTLRGEHGERVGYVSVQRRVGERARAVAELRRVEEELRRRSEQQALVVELGRGALAGTDLQALMDQAVVLVARTLDVELAGVAELLPPGDGVLVLRAGVGWADGVVGSLLERDGTGSQAGYTLLRGEPVIAEDAAADTRFTLSAFARAAGVVSGLTVMIASPHQPFGVLSAMATSTRAFSSTDVSFVRAVANVLAAAVDRSRAQQRLADAREAERRRLARDLHDEALRELAEAVVLAGATDPVDDPASASARLGRLLPVLTAVGEHLRNVIDDLRTADDGKASFAELAEELVAVHRTLAPGAEVALELGDGLPSGPLGATGNEVLRILGEALANVRRHAGAAHVHVRVSATGGELRAEVRDDGSGIDVATSAHGNGLKGMRERAQLLHGTLDVAGTPGTGTTVRLAVPLRGGGDNAPTAPGQVRVLLVEDHVAVREALAAAFARDAGFAIAGQASSLAEARELLEDVDVAVLDLALPDGFGADLISELRRVSPGAQALVLSATLDDAEVARAIEAGAAGVLNKVAALGEVVVAVRRLQAGETLMPLAEVVAVLRAAGDRRAREHDDRRAIAQLTPREREVLRGLAEGLDTEQLADRLHISVRTERNHIASILAKLGVHSRLQALVFALRYGIVEIR